MCHKPDHNALHCFHIFDHSFHLVYTAHQAYQQHNYHNNLGNIGSSNMTTLLSSPDFAYDTYWFPDSGASSHVTSDSNNLLQGTEYNGPEQLHMGNSTGLPIKRIGYSFVQSTFNPSISLSLQNLLHVLSITKNQISVSKFAKDTSIYFEFHPNHCYVKSQDRRKHCSKEWLD